MCIRDSPRTARRRFADGPAVCEWRLRQDAAHLVVRRRQVGAGLPHQAHAAALLRLLVDGRGLRAL
eukprot:2955195-Prymnesium_polylepis.1